MNPKRRWWLSFVAIGIVGVAAIVVFLTDRQEDLPTLRLVRVEEDGQEMMVFRFDAPKNRAAVVGTARTVSPATGIEKPIQPLWGGPVKVITGESTEISVLMPVDQVWRLRCNVTLHASSLKGLVEKVRLCWKQKSLAPLRWTLSSEFSGLTVESEPITKAVPPTIDNPPLDSTGVVTSE